MEVFYIIIVVLMAGVIFYLLRRQKKIRHETREWIEQNKKETAASMAIIEERLKTESEEAIQEMMAEHSVLVANIEDAYERQLHQKQEYIDYLKRTWHNAGEAETFKILSNIKKIFIREHLLSDNEMLIIGNIFIPYSSETGEMKLGHIDHLVLLPSGLYAIETKNWPGQVFHGLTKTNAHGFGFLLAMLCPNAANEEEHTLVFTRQKNNGLENPDGAVNVALYTEIGAQVSEAAKQLMKKIAAYDSRVSKVKPIICLGGQKSAEDRSANFTTREKPLVFSDQKTLYLFFQNEIKQQNRLFTEEDLGKIGRMVKKARDFI
ncbi:nuclease-related domain-containing protein [Terrilactibacillus sp. S3-3]|nr:nuclease-related domain-containing protein [Terrilactibacillus sp. S3-3]